MNKFAKYVPEEDKKKQREHIGVSWESLPDKPFGEITETIIVEETTVDMTNSNQLQNPFSFEWTNDLFDTPVIVRWGDTNTQTAVEYEGVFELSNGAVVIGNTSLAGMGENTGEPFLIAMLATNNIRLFANAGAVYNVSIVRKNIGRLDAQYLPKIPLDKMETSPYVHLHATDGVCSMTSNEVYALIQKGAYFTLSVNADIARHPLKDVIINSDGNPWIYFGTLDRIDYPGGMVREYILKPDGSVLTANCLVSEGIAIKSSTSDKTFLIKIDDNGELSAEERIFTVL